jgi:hemolysin III
MYNIAKQPHSKPFLRGRFHEAAFFFALGACAMLMAKSQSSINFAASLVYSLSLCGLYGVSALYHRRTWSDKNRVRMKRVDHAAIFILIAGTGTPIFLLGLPTEIGSRLLLIIWSMAAAGVLQSLFWVKAPKWLTSIFYVIVGWAVVPYLPELRATLSSVNIGFILAGGIIYTVGAIIYALKKPNPYPKTFGYHEIFHVLVIAGSACHFIVVNSLMGTN